MRITNKITLLLLSSLCIIWFFIGIYYTQQKNINIYITDIIINPLGISIIIYAARNNNLKNKSKFILSLYFFLYGSFFLIYDCYFTIATDSIHNLDTFYFISDILMIYLSINICFREIYVAIKRIIK